jgi:hypothetical protein
MIDYVTAIGNSAEERFQELNDSVNGLIAELLDFCSAPEDRHWLLSKFAGALSANADTIQSAYAPGIEIYMEAHAFPNDKIIDDPCWFWISPSSDVDYDTVTDGASDYILETYDRDCPNGNFMLCENPQALLAHFPPIQLLVPDGHNAAEWVKWILQHSPYTNDFESEEIAKLVEQTVFEFVDFIETKCESVLIDVCDSIYDKYGENFSL